jgi:TonB-dependent receptor
LEPGKTVVRDVALTAEIYKLDKFTVAGVREGTALAETLQRQAPNVKNVVSSDTFGNISDGNIGDLLQRVAGITANHNGHEVRQVSIRGVSAELNSVTMDGQQVASAQSAGTGRAFEFEQSSLGNIESIEVTKAPTPDMDGASIGGSVNLVTKSAFNRAVHRNFSYTVGFVTRPTYKNDERTWKQPIAGFGPSINFVYSDVIGAKRNLGIVLTGTVHSLPGSGSTTLFGFERRDDPGPAFAFSSGRRVEGSTQSRLGTDLKLDYKWSAKTTISLNTSYNFNHANVDTRGSTLATVGVPTAATPQVLAVVDAGGNRIGGGYINPSYATGITRVYAHPTLSANALSATAQDKSGRTFVVAPTVRHRFDGLNIDYGLNYSNAATYYDISHDKEKYRSRPKGNVTLRLANIGWIVDRSRDPILPTITQTEGPNMYDLNNFSGLLLGQDDRRGYDTVVGGKFDLKKILPVALPTFVKTGLTYQSQSRKLWNTNRRYNYTGPDGIRGNADDNQGIGQFTDTALYHERDARVYRDRGGSPVWPDPYGVARHQKDHPELWKEDLAFGAQSRVQSLRLITERIAAAYVMGNVRLGRVSVLSGVRVEDTRLHGEGPLNYISPAERTRRAAWVGPVTEAEAVRRVEAEFGGRTTNKGQYRNIFPGVHLKYEPIDGMVTRLSWSTGVGRPPFGSIIPNTTVNDSTQRVTVNNPDLKPQYANNYDLSAEYYFKSQGMVSVGGFRKKIVDYIAADSSQIVGSGADNGFDGQYEGYSLITSRNGGDATIEGLEASYQQQLTFLPGWTKGFGIYANITKLKTHGNNSAFQTGPTTTAGGTLAGFLSTTGNVGLSYRGYGLDLRLQAVHRGRYLTSNSATPSLVQYQKSKTSWNWKSRYAFSRRMSLFLDLENIFSEPLDTIYALYPDRVVNNRTFRTKIIAGVTGRL